jgi:hypothetical protein
LATPVPLALLRDLLALAAFDRYFEKSKLTGAVKLKAGIHHFDG